MVSLGFFLLGCGASPYKIMVDLYGTLKVGLCTGGGFAQYLPFDSGIVFVIHVKWFTVLTVHEDNNCD